MLQKYSLLLLLKSYKTHTDTFREYMCNYINKHMLVEKMVMLRERCLAYMLKIIQLYIMKATKVQTEW